MGIACYAPTVRAQEPNNKFGIHLAGVSNQDLEDAAALVNSNGGDWGYVTIVIQENDRDVNKWQAVFDKMRELHLVPIMRLATSFQDGSWKRARVDQTTDWVNFLDSLNWVVKNRYVILFNEPNQGAEWGGGVDPVGFGKVVEEFAKALKENSPDYFVMLAGLDAAAPNQFPQYADEEVFLKQMVTGNGGAETFFENIDGWATHSYPNYGFVSSPYATGRPSVRTYVWELGLLGRLGVKKELPVFVTETGWPHAEGVTNKYGYFTENKVAQNFVAYFKQMVSDQRVVAVTPFVLNYQSELFEHFSWRIPEKLGSQRRFYQQYEIVQQMAKTAGLPEQRQEAEIGVSLPEKVLANSTYQFPIQIKNKGQAVWSLEDGYKLKATANDEADVWASDFSKLLPGQEEQMWLYLKTKDQEGVLSIELQITRNDRPVEQEDHFQVTILPRVNIDFEESLFPKGKVTAEGFKFVIFDEQERPIYQKDGIRLKGGEGKVEDINNLVVGKEYRLVLLKQGYIPRQARLKVNDQENRIVFEPMVPFDIDEDGKFTVKDGWSCLRNFEECKSYWF